MIIRCGHCQRMFSHDLPGEVVCPHCHSTLQTEAGSDGPANPSTSPPGTLNNDESAPAPRENPAPPGGQAPEENEPPPGGFENYWDRVTEARRLEERRVAGATPVWEMRGEFGWWLSFITTVRTTLRYPRELFRGMRTDEEGVTVTYAWIVWAIGLAGLFFNLMMVYMVPGQAEQLSQALEETRRNMEMAGRPAPELPTIESVRAFILMMLAMSPLIAYAMAYVLSGVFHLSIIMSPMEHKGYAATMRAVIYASTPALFLAIPVIGFYTGIPLLAWYLYIAISEIHGIGRLAGVMASVTAWLMLVFLGSTAMALLLGLATAITSKG
ncbi:MAG: hypothetical protein GMKNLPBB_00166 [Myxococcota bacterium]|nr:hypothetical protein [Myxococcota bacterium]